MATRKPSASAQLSSDFRFLDGGIRTGLIEQSGKLTLIEGAGSITSYESWRDFVKEVMGEIPVVASDEAEILNQIGQVLGVWEPVTVVVSGKQRPASTTNEEATTGEETMATTKKAVPAKKAAPVKKAAKAEVVQSPCKCGCGTMVNKNYAPGHDARVHGWAKKIQRGDMKFSEIPAIAQNFLKKELGVTQGVAPKA